MSFSTGKDVMDYGEDEDESSDEEEFEPEKESSEPESDFCQLNWNCLRKVSIFLSICTWILSSCFSSCCNLCVASYIICK